MLDYVQLDLDKMRKRLIVRISMVDSKHIIGLPVAHTLDAETTAKLKNHSLQRT